VKRMDVCKMKDEKLNIKDYNRPPLHKDK